MTYRWINPRYTTGLLVSALAFVVVNIIDRFRLPTCSDCFLRHGLPFTFYHEGGFAGGAGFVWSGVAGDIVAMVILGIAIGWAWSRISKPHSAEL